MLYWWRELNTALFDDNLNPPIEFKVKDLGDETGAECWTNHAYSKHQPVIIVVHEEYENREEFLTYLAHEMVHQWEQQNYGTMRHGKRFYSWKDKLKTIGLPLAIAY